METILLLLLLLLLLMWITTCWPYGFADGKNLSFSIKKCKKMFRISDCFFVLTTQPPIHSTNRGKNENFDNSMCYIFCCNENGKGQIGSLRSMSGLSGLRVSTKVKSRGYRNYNNRGPSSLSSDVRWHLLLLHSFQILDGKNFNKFQKFIDS